MKLKLVLLLFVNLVHINAAELEAQIDACNKGDDKRCYEAGMVLTTGKNSEDQDKRVLGLEYMRKACGGGVKEACHAMAENHYINRHYIAAKPYLKMSCSDGIVFACASLGTMYRDGQEVTQDDVLAREYYEKACEGGEKDSCINVAIMHRGGFGVPKDRSKEKLFYNKACVAGSEAGCKQHSRMDNEDKGIEEEGFFDTIVNFFK